MMWAKRWPVGFWSILLLLVAGGVLAFLTFPYLRSAFYLEAGGRSMDNPAIATEHLQKATKWDPENAQAHRLLGRAYQAEGNLQASVEAFARYIELRPGNPLGYIELAQTHERIQATIATMWSVDLLSLLPQAAVQAPEVPVDTPYRQPGEPLWQSYVAETDFGLPPHYGERPTLFMHPPARVTYTLDLPSQPALLRFDLGMHPQSHDWPGDGATFQVFVNGEQVFQEHLDKKASRQGWHPRAVELAPWAGQDVTLTLGVTPGPAGDASGDWTGWGEPRVQEMRLAELEPVSSRTQMMEVWRRSGLTAKDLLDRGKMARQADQDDEAMTWYERAIRLAPHLSDPWYHVGLLNEGQKQWQEALAAYKRALELDHFEQVGRSSPAYRMGLIYQRKLEPPQIRDARAAYKAALKADDFRSRKDRAWAHARLGQVWYLLEGDAAKAEAEILEALAMVPQDKWLHFALGDLYREEGQLDRARALYRKSLEIDPSFEASQKRLDELQE
jgi:tetratricopeptide (TPR) repeat protein